MGKHFGNLQRLTGVNYYCLSPNEMNPFKGVLFPGIPNTFRRLILRNLFTAGIPFALGYCVYYSINDSYKKSFHKNPDDYKDEV